MNELNLKQLLQNVERVLFIYPHPDDEVPFSCGLAQKITTAGVKAELVCLTRGELSTLNYIDAPDLAAARLSELKNSSTITGYDSLKVEKFKDGHLDTQREQLETYLKRLTRAGDLLITYEPGGLTGHSDHKLVSAIVAALPQPTLFATCNEALISRINPSAIESQVEPLKPEFMLTLSDEELNKKMQAIKAHASQWGEDGLKSQGMWRNQNDLRVEYFAWG